MIILSREVKDGWQTQITFSDLLKNKKEVMSMIKINKLKILTKEKGYIYANNHTREVIKCDPV